MAKAFLQLYPAAKLRVDSETLKICVFGLGYVGTTTSVCLAELGFEVVGVDTNEERLLLQIPAISIQESGVEELLQKP